MTESLNDADELALLKGGDQAAFARLVKAHHRALLALARPIVGESEAVEVVQTAWIKAHAALKDFEGRAALRSWLSQWSYDDARGDGIVCGRDITVPALVVGNLADDACTPSHTRRLFEAIGHDDKEIAEIPGANHYYAGPGQRETLRQAVGVVTDWLVRHDFAVAPT